MMKIFYRMFSLLCFGVIASLMIDTIAAEEEKIEVAAKEKITPDAKDKKYSLRYKLQSGETLRTKVVHRSAITTTVKDTTQTSQSVAVSTKRWRVYDVLKDGQMKFTHQIDNVKMWQKVSGSAEVKYDSEKDKNPPEGYSEVAKTVGIPLSDITLDSSGKVIKRERKTKRTSADVSGGEVTIPLPKKPIAIGETWNNVYTIPVIITGGREKQIKARQYYKLTSVEKGIAKISVKTQIITPGLTPQVEVQLIQKVSNGEAHFNIELGRVIYQKMKVDGTVQQFRGPESIMKCKIIFEETLLPKEAKTAKKPQPKVSVKSSSGEKPAVVGRRSKNGSSKFKR